jgi:hypothetical protein
MDIMYVCSDHDVLYRSLWLCLRVRSSYVCTRYGGFQGDYILPSCNLPYLNLRNNNLESAEIDEILLHDRDLDILNS